MSFKNALTKLGLVEETVEVPKKTPSASVSTTPVAPARQYQPTPTAPTVDPAIMATLLQSMQDSKLSGFDYLKFIATVEEMKSTGTPEDARFKMAFVAAKQLGVDKDGLAKSGQHYVDVLKQDEADFNSDCAQYEKDEIKSRETKIAELSNRLASLNEQLAQTQKDYSELTSTLEEKKSSLESRKASFQSALENLEGAIQNNISKINQYL